jgi:hypothetical protein
MASIRIDYGHQLHARITRSHKIPSTSLRRDSLIYFSKGTLREVVSDQRGGLLSRIPNVIAPRHTALHHFFYLSSFFFFYRPLWTEAKTEKQMNLEVLVRK